MKLSMTAATRFPRYLKNASVWFSLLAVIVLSGCASFKAPELKAPSALKNFSLPDLSIPENHPSFRKRLYAGASFGTTTLKPDTGGTVFTVANDSSTSTQLRIGIDLHNKLSLELDTAVLGQSDLAQAGTSVSYTAASVSALVYGLTGVKNRSLRQGWSAYGRIGYSMLQRASEVIPLDYTDNGLILGIGGEYGLKSGLAFRAELTRFDSDASAVNLGAIYRFGRPPESIAKVFVNAAKPALTSDDTRVAAAGRALGGSNMKTEPLSHNRQQPLAGSSLALAAKRWQPKAGKNDVDGDGVKNALDQCPDTVPTTTVNKDGCGLFDAVLSNVTFKPGSSWLTPKARGELDALTITMLAFPEARVQIRAHTDNKGPADLNLALSARRAESVVTYLREQGVGEMQLETMGLGESQPIDTNDTAEGRKRNRRVELLTLPNISDQTLLDSAAVAKATVITGEPVPISEKSTDKIAAAATAVPKQFADPVFPPMTGVKIEPLPKPAYVAGLGLGGVLKGLEFNDGSAILTAGAKQVLNDVSAKLQRYPEVRLAIMVHTDDQRPAEESKALSKKRANVVVNHLVSLGIDSARLSAEGYGASLPLAQNLTDADRARNRRVELRVIE